MFFPKSSGDSILLLENFNLLKNSYKSMKIFIQGHRVWHFVCIAFFLIYGFFISHQWAPLLFKLRPYLFWIFSGLASIFSIILLLFRRHFSKEISILYIYITAFLVTFSCYRQWVFYLEKDRVLYSQNPVLTLVGKHIISGFTDWKEISMLSERGLIGGIFLTARNVEHFSTTEIKEKIDSLQKKRIENSLPALFICSDQEGGIVSRLSPPLTKQPSLMEFLNDIPEADKKNKIIEYAKIQGGQLKSIGVNVNFSPVVDLPSNVKSLVSHTQIEKRAIAKDSKSIALYASWYSDSLLTNNILPTYKHFPGIGKIDTDTHFFTGVHKSTWSQLLQDDAFPFAELIQNKLPAWIMLSHTIIPDLDSSYPVSFSEIVISVFRKELSYNGILITDDLSMGPSYYTGIENVSDLALKAGVDYLLISYDKDLIYPILHHFLEHDLETMKKILSPSQERINLSMKFILPKPE